MGEAEQSGMQRLTREGGDPGARRTDASDRSAGPRAIHRIPYQWMPEMGQMNADLVGPPGGEAAFDLRRMTLECAQDPVSGDRRLPLSFRNDRHFFAVHNAAANIAGDLAGRCGRHTPHKSGISAIDPARGEIA